MEKSRIPVLIVDDFEPFRRFLCPLLEKRPDLDVPCQASDGMTAVHKAEELQPGLVLLDIGLPKLNGLEAASRIARVCPKTKLLMVTQNQDNRILSSVLGNGGRGYVLKTDARNEILLAIDAVLAERNFVSSSLRSRFQIDLEGKPVTPVITQIRTY